MERIARNICMCVFILSCVPAYGHDTTHIHPLISLEIVKLIESIDVTGNNNAYSELYERSPTSTPGIDDAVNFFYWGTDFDPVGMNDAIAQGQPLSEYLVNEQEGRYTSNNNVIDGVVFEDNPAIFKVRHHFYQAKSGIALTLPILGAIGESSEIRAMRFFNQSINTMGDYTDVSKQESFFLFGQALHHVEDMTSPAHVHNDAHLDKLPLERDDYEGWWLPQQKNTAESDVDLNVIIGGATSVELITNPWVNIWGINTGDNSLVQQTWNKTTFDASLSYTFSVFEEIAGSYEYFTNAGLVPDPVGEMAQMFPCPQPVASPDICLHWSEDAPDDPAHWVINNVGGFQHQAQAGVDDAWWPIEVETDISTIGQEPSPFVSDIYYIEQLASNNEATNPLGDVVVPAALRSSLSVGWIGNMVEDNTTSLLKKYAEELLVPAVTYGAGFTQYWYDIANAPPYLKSFKALQRPDGASGEVEVYRAQWNDVLSDDEFIDDILQPKYVVSRSLGQGQQSVEHIDSEQELNIELEFNEPVSVVGELMIGSVNMLPYIVPLAPTEDGVIWKATIPASALATLNGKSQVSVKATDKNNHRRGSDCVGGEDSAGSALDSTPLTPAKRDLSLAMNEDLPTGLNCYPWFVEPALNATPDEIAYSYDYTDGDQNHWLVFDTGNPSAMISIDVTLP